MIEQNFIQGSEWLYYKLYTGVKIADNLLKNEIASIIFKLRKKNLIDKWFYVRYADPEFHLRVRVRIKNYEVLGEIMYIFHHFINQLCNDNIIWRVQIDTYKQELNRYSELLINEAESFFCIDSDFSLTILKQLSLNQNENFRWKTSILMIDSLLNDFSYTINEKYNLLKKLNTAFKTEFGFNKYNSKQFNSIFRENKLDIENLLNDKHNIEFKIIFSILDRRSVEIKKIVDAIKCKIDYSSKSIDDLISNYIHMMLNRHFRNKNRLYELIIYDFLKRYYESVIAKNKYYNYHRNFQ